MHNTAVFDRIYSELEAARKALKEGNDGRARACCRRAAGLVIQASELEVTKSASAVGRLRLLSINREYPESIQKAAQRLTTNVRYRLDRDFAFNPIQDALTIISYFSPQFKP